MSYSDSDDSDAEQPKAAPPPRPVVKAPAPSSTNFSIDRANPQKIRVKLADTSAPNRTHEDEPSPKRPRVGGGRLNGFNSLLPAPKRDADAKPLSPAAKGPARKVFSLKTGAEPGFSRESDAELKNFFAQQDDERGSGRADEEGVGMPDVPERAPVASVATEQPALKRATFMFKPLSVARNPKQKKKPVNGNAKITVPTGAPLASTMTSESEPRPSDPPPKKINLFSMQEEKDGDVLPAGSPEEDDRDLGPGDDQDYSAARDPMPAISQNREPQNLDSIASDLNLSAAERRQLFGRNLKNPASAANISNFNMDQEYLANEELRATGEQVQHNPLRAIAPGKHSLKQLVSVAQGQKDALEESFASGRRNKKEAGNKYGW